MKSYFVIFVFLLKSVSALPLTEEYPSSTEVLPVSSQSPSLTSTVPPPSETTTITEEPTRPSTPASTITKRLISFDQRQEGKYNIRADLENFLIVVVPSNPSSSLSLLDLLTRSAIKKNHAKHANKRTKTANKIKNSEHEHEQQQQQQQTEFGVSENKNKQVLDEFVEGRTPYKVDISSTETGTNTELQVVPVTLGRSPQIVHNIKPVVPLEIDVPIVSTRSSSGNLQPFSSIYPVVTVGSQRKTKSLSELNGEFNTNSVVRITDLNGGHRGFTDLTDTNDSFETLNIGNLDTLNEEPQFTDGWELKLIGSQEQCGPDRRRDSYGVCQFGPVN